MAVIRNREFVSFIAKSLDLFKIRWAGEIIYGDLKKLLFSTWYALPNSLQVPVLSNKMYYMYYDVY